MWFYNLRMAVLTSAFAANAVTGTAKMDVKLTAPRTASTPTTFRDDLVTSEVKKIPSVDGEGRGVMTLAEFANLIGKTRQSKAVKGLKSRVFEKYMNERMTPKDVYNQLHLSNPDYKFLANVRWIKWIYLLCQLSSHFEENIFKFIIAAMSVTHDYEALADQLLFAVKNEKTKPFAINLIKVANEQIKGRVLKHMPWLGSELSHQEQHPAEKINKTLRDRIDAYMKKPFVIAGIKREIGDLEKMKFSVLTSYLSVLFSKDHAVGTGQTAAYKYSEDVALLKYLLSLDKFYDQDYIRSLVSFYLDMNKPPSKVVSMLMQNESKAKQVIFLFSNKSSRRFWLHYLEMYNERNYGDKLPRTAISNFEQLLDVLNKVEKDISVPESAFSNSAISTWLKVLTLPHFAHLEKSQLFRKNLMSIWLKRKIPPFGIVSALILGETRGDCFTLLFLNESSKNFWVRYFEQYFQNNCNHEVLMQSGNIDFEGLVEILFGVAEQETPAADKFVAYRTILKLLISPYSTYFSSSHEHVIELMSILLFERTLPTDVLSMLMHGEADADKFNILFVDKMSKRFWVRYLKTFFEYSFIFEDSTSTANTDFQQLLYMLHAVGAREVAEADQILVRSIILKILVSPEIAKIVDQKYLEEMVSTWLQQRIHPSEVVSMLVLEEVDSNRFQILFTNTPSSKLWEDYTKAYYADPSPQQNHRMSTLIQAFGDANLERILKTALAIKATSEKAKALLTQLDRCKLKRPHPNDMVQTHSGKKVKS